MRVALTIRVIVKLKGFSGYTQLMLMVIQSCAIGIKQIYIFFGIY